MTDLFKKQRELNTKVFCLTVLFFGVEKKFMFICICIRSRGLGLADMPDS